MLSLVNLEDFLKSSFTLLAFCNILDVYNNGLKKNNVIFFCIIRINILQS